MIKNVEDYLLWVYYNSATYIRQQQQLKHSIKGYDSQFCVCIKGTFEQ